jgi:hypothetical protein
MVGLVSVSSMPLAPLALEITKFLFEERPHPNENDSKKKTLYMHPYFKEMRNI